MKNNNYVSMPLERYEDLLQKEFLANSLIQSGDFMNIEQVKWLIQNYKDNMNMKSK